MRRHTIPAVLFAVLFVTAFCGISHAAPLEFHGGVYTSYEYTDNYNGTARDEKSESIYEVGPSGQVIYQEGPTRLDLSGHVTRNFHNRYSDGNFYGVFLDTRFSSSITPTIDSVSLGYTFTQTDRRDEITDVVGKAKIHVGTANYTRELTQATRLGLGYTYGLEINEAPYDDIRSQGVTGTLFHQFSQRNSGTLMVGYDTHDYTANEDETDGEVPDADDTNDTKVLRSALGFDSLVTQRTTIGTDLEYQHQNNETTPDGDISSVFLNWGYSLTQSTNVLLSGGYSWVDMEGYDREGSYVTRAELTTRTLVDVITVRIAREYTAEFTTDRFGTYDTRTANASWERTLLRDLVLLSTITYEDRKPVSAVDLTYPDQEEEEKDFSGMVSLTWTPLRYLRITPSYEHRQRDFEIADTERENRYRIIAEVRY